LLSSYAAKKVIRGYVTSNIAVDVFSVHKPLQHDKVAMPSRRELFGRIWITSVQF
jgi:hypothetical protein